MSALFIQHTMVFEQEKLIERDIEIAGYLLQGLSLKQIFTVVGVRVQGIAAKQPPTTNIAAAEQHLLYLLIYLSIFILLPTPKRV